MKLVNIHSQLLMLLFIAIGVQSIHAQVWTLDQCIDTAQIYNKNLKMSRNTIALGEQKSKEARANLIPKVSANAEYKYFTDLPYQLMPLSTFNPAAPEGQFKEAQFGVPHTINANLQLSMPLYNPQIYGAIHATEIGADLTELYYKKTEEQIFFEISNLYYNAQILLHQRAFIDSNLLNAEKLLGNVQLLNEQLLAKETDVAKLKLQVAQLRAQSESLNSKYLQVLNALKFSIGIPLEYDLQLEITVRFESTIDYSSSNTMDYRIAKTQSQIIGIELNTLNRSRYLPTLNLLATYGTTGFGYSDESNRFLKFYPIGFAGVQFSYPLFNGTVVQRKINQKSIELQNSELQLELLSDQNNFQIQNAQLQQKIAKQTVETVVEQITLAQRIYEQTLLQQQQGTASLTDVLLSDNSLREAQQMYLTALIEYLKADLELKKLTGNISSSND